MNVLSPVKTLLKRILPSVTLMSLREGRTRMLALRDRFYSVEKDAFRQGLRALGIRVGDVVFVHSSYDQMRSILATPTEVIEILCEVVGEAGTVVMPSFPASNASQHQESPGRVFDVRRTPSGSGILTEVFRRMPGTERSLHPIYPVAARGGAAAWLVEHHDLCEIAFDEHSPFHKIYDCNGCVLRIGRFEPMTFRHLADYLIRGEIAYPIYNEQAMKVRVIGRFGEEQVVVTKDQNPDIGCDHGVVLKRMAREGRLRTAMVGRVPLALVRAREYVEAYHHYYRRGMFRHYRRSPSQGVTSSDSFGRGRNERQHRAAP